MKFRAYRHSLKRFMSWDEIENYISFVTDGADMSFEFTHPDDVEIIRSTGREASGRKEIYEKDLLSRDIRGGSKIGIVLWHPDECGFVWVPSINVDMDDIAMDFEGLGMYALEEFTIVGNFLENPEMLPQDGD